MTNLTEQRIIELFQEEWSAKKSRLRKSLLEFLGREDEPDQEGIISDETKVRHKGSQLLYTVDQVGPDRIVLRTPEGDVFEISGDEFEKEYELD